MPVISSSPVTLSLNANVNQAVTFAIPPGVWATATWEVIGTIASSASGGQLQTIVGSDSAVGSSHGSNGTYDDVFAASSQQLTSINAAAGGNLTVNLRLNASPGATDAVTTFTLTLVGGGGGLPAVQPSPTPPSITNAVSGDGTAVVVKNTLADVDFRHNAANPNAAHLENVAGQRGMGVLSGLTLVAPGSGLNLTILAGKANIGAVVEYAGGTLAIADNTTRYVWLQQDGQPIALATTAAPSQPAVFLGTATASGGNITAVSMTGVVRLLGAQMVRQTSDTGMPADSPPPSVVLFNRSASGTYLWNGSEYVPLGVPQQSSDPASPVAGDVWLNTTEGAIKARVGGSTVTIGGSSVVRSTVALGTSTSVPSGSQQLVMDTLTVRGLTTVRGLLKIRRL
ncbi:MAG: hypothetical protein M3315_08290 [Actinomycetota bacterium]|nr:hypothetical protein [Actinomycetota bacterium]